MKQSQIIEAVIYDFQPNELILASNLFNNKLDGTVCEATYYKTLERMSKAGKLNKAAKGVYYLPKNSRFGPVPLSEEDIILAFTKENTGTVVGYSLYNQLGLTTQIPKITKILSASLETQTKTIQNVAVFHSPLWFSREVEYMVHTLDVLQNLGQIQDLNQHALISYCEIMAETYDQSVFDEVITKQKYSKSTIAFLQSILTFYNKENGLSKYLSSLSTYKFPRIENLNVSKQLI